MERDQGQRHDHGERTDGGELPRDGPVKAQDNDAGGNGAANENELHERNGDRDNDDLCEHEPGRAPGTGEQEVPVGPAVLHAPGGGGKQSDTHGVEQETVEKRHLRGEGSPAGVECVRVVSQVDGPGDHRQERKGEGYEPDGGSLELNEFCAEHKFHLSVRSRRRVI